MDHKKIFSWLIVVLIILLLLAGIVAFLHTRRTITSAPVARSISGLYLLYPAQNQSVSSPLTIVGMVNGQGWNGFEGQVGTVLLQDNNHRILAKAALGAVSSWTHLPINFKTSLVFKNPGKGVGTLVFHNENSSALVGHDKTFVLPVTFK